MNVPDWQLPTGVDRGLWAYLHATDMVNQYDDQMAASPLAAVDLAFCERVLVNPGRVIDLGCGTGRFCRAFARRGFDCVGVDLSEAMLAQARTLAEADGLRVDWHCANLVDLATWPMHSFDFAVCLFSTLGMVRGADPRRQVVANAFRLLKPRGRFVLHVHNRYFRGLGPRRVLGQVGQTLFGLPSAGDIAMPQSYGGAPLTLHHFTRSEVIRLLEGTGFAVSDVQAIDANGQPARFAWGIYGWLIAAERPDTGRREPPRTGGAS